MKQVKEPVYIIIPVHNRKLTTLKCLETLESNGDLGRYYVVVVDDGSIDGTSEAIAEQYPDVIILKGDGNLWWTGAIELGMRYAYKQGADYILWLNDDTLPKKETILKLLEFCQNNSKAIAASQCYFQGKFTYGGQIRKHLQQLQIHADINSLVQCDALDGNLVCLPRSIIKKIGYPNGKAIPQYGGDNLYTWNAKKSGYTLYLLGDAISICPMDHPQVSWTLDPDPIWKYWKIIFSPKSINYMPGCWNFCVGYWGIIGILAFMQPYLRLIIISLLRLLLPYDWLRFIKYKFNGGK